MFIQTTTAVGKKTATLKASDGAANSQFGLAVAICDEHIIVGSPWAPIDGGSSAGAAYLFEYDGAVSGWQQSFVFESKNPISDEWFGRPVACW